jgi:hypothetical protein
LAVPSVNRYIALSLAALAVAALAIPLHPAGGAANPLALPAALDRLVSAEQALDQARRDYRAVRARRSQDGGALDAQEARDFEGFIQALAEQVQTACQSVASLGGDLSAHAAYCAPADTPDSAAGALRLARTRQEAVAAVDNELDVAIGVFDEMLLREQRALARRTPRARGGDGPFPPGGQQDDGQLGGRGSGGVSWSDPDAGKTPEGLDDEGRPLGAPGPQSADASRAPVPADIPDGRDDDVVARQLREAAMKETDPELRKRLWDEYRRYKNGGG